jgi:hypothetical protein
MAGDTITAADTDADTDADSDNQQPIVTKDQGHFDNQDQGQQTTTVVDVQQQQQ